MQVPGLHFKRNLKLSDSTSHQGLGMDKFNVVRNM